jgi:glycosyltransferase involved in cell wall biosynthesis
MFRLRFLRGTRLIYVFHEPFDSVANYHRSGFGLVKIAKIMLINLVNVPLLWMAHEVILPSSASYALYKKKYRWLNASFQRIPLLFDDELSGGELAADAKDCISYIGTVAADHAFDRFVDFVAHSVGQGLLPGKSFLIATRSEIPPRERETLQGLAPSGRVIVQCGRPMSTDEINAHYRRSAVVWNAYHRSNQSGVLPKAFMFGSAVISSTRTSNEFVDDRVTGIVIRDNSDVAEIAAAVSEICADGPRYAQACRAKFLSTFYYRSKMKEFIDLLGHQKPRALEES